MGINGFTGSFWHCTFSQSIVLKTLRLTLKVCEDFWISQRDPCVLRVYKCKKKKKIAIIPQPAPRNISSLSASNMTSLPLHPCFIEVLSTSYLSLSNPDPWSKGIIPIVHFCLHFPTFRTLEGAWPGTQDSVVGWRRKRRREWKGKKRIEKMGD